MPGSADIPQHGVESGVARHHGAPELLEPGQDLGLVLVPSELQVDQDAVHEDLGVTWHNLLEESQILDDDLVLGHSFGQFQHSICLDRAYLLKKSD